MAPLNAQPVKEDGLRQLRNDMHDHQMARPRAGCELEERRGTRRASRPALARPLGPRSFVPRRSREGRH